MHYCNCTSHKHQICHLKGIGYFDVNLAIELIKKNRKRKREYYLDNFRVRRVFSSERFNYIKKLFNNSHLNHIPKQVWWFNKTINPIIIGTYLEDDKERNFILEGNRRVARALRDNLCITYFKLTLKETMKTFSKNPPKSKKFVL